MNFHCLGQLYCGDSSFLLLPQEQNNLKGESLAHKYFRPTQRSPYKLLSRILVSVCSVCHTREELFGAGGVQKGFGKDYLDCKLISFLF